MSESLEHIGFAYPVCRFRFVCDGCPAFDISKPFPDEVPETHVVTLKCPTCEQDIKLWHGRTSETTIFQMVITCCQIINQITSQTVSD